MTVSTRSLRGLRAGAARMMPLIFAGFGFLAGALYSAATKGGEGIFPVPDLRSAFLRPSPFAFLISRFSGELKYAFLIYLLGFCSFGAAGCGMVIALRSALSGFAAVYLLLGSYSLSEYFLLSVSSLLTLAALCCLCSLSSAFSRSGAGQGGIRAVLPYTAKCLFFTGLIFIFTLTRHLLMLII